MSIALRNIDEADSTDLLPFQRNESIAMRLLKLSAIALALETAYGYLDTSPFFMFSTSEYDFPFTYSACDDVLTQ